MNDENVTKEDVIDLIKENLFADDGDPSDAEDIYKYFSDKGVNWLLREFLLVNLEDQDFSLDEIAADIGELK